jgi:hypothetical protein
MNSRKESAPTSREAVGRSGSEVRLPTGVIRSMAAILTDHKPLAHIGEWGTRIQLATALSCDIGTVSRRCRKAGVTERLVVTDGHRARVEFLMADVRTKLLGVAR